MTSSLKSASEKDNNNDDDNLSIVTEAQSVASVVTVANTVASNNWDARSTQSSLKARNGRRSRTKERVSESPTIIRSRSESEATSGEKRPTIGRTLSESEEREKNVYFDYQAAKRFSYEEFQSKEKLLRHANRPNLLGYASNKFPTRGALEDEIGRLTEGQKTLLASQCSKGSESSLCSEPQICSMREENEHNLKAINYKISTLLPLRNILPTIEELSEMISILQHHKEEALRKLDIEKSECIQSEMDEIQCRMEEEEHYLLRRHCCLEKVRYSVSRKGLYYV